MSLIDYFRRKKKAPEQLEPETRTKRYSGAEGGRLFSDWQTSTSSPSETVRADLKTLRGRSRDLCINNDYAKRFLGLLSTNVIGPKGIRLQSKVVRADGKPDKKANEKIEAAWTDWSKKQNASVDGRLTRIDIERLVIQAVARDGEILIRKHKYFKDNSFRFALQVIEADHLDTELNVFLSNGSRIVMGIELNKFSRPVAYHITKDHPGDRHRTTVNRDAVRIPADEILHLYIMDRPGQARGVPWFASSIKRLRQVGSYEEAELVAARVGAAKMGFFIPGEQLGMNYDDKDSDGNLINEVAPGKFEELPPGYDFKSFDIDHPSTGFDAFVKAVLRGAASGLNVSYASLASDLENTSYSSIRQGVLDERDYWKCLQGWMIDHFQEQIFSDWLEMAVSFNALDLPVSKFEKFKSPLWQGRRWAWVDPLKDMKANSEAIDQGLRSRTSIAAESGDDIEDVFDDLEREKEMAEEKGLVFGANKGAEYVEEKED